MYVDIEWLDALLRRSKFGKFTLNTGNVHLTSRWTLDFSVDGEYR
jgi:hypothetical protein